MQLSDAPTLEALVRELDVLVRSSFSLIAVETHEENRLHRAVEALRELPHHERKHLYTWSRPRGLRLRVQDGLHTAWQAIEGGEDPIGLLETIGELAREKYIAPDGEVEGALFVLCDYAPWIQPLGAEDPEVVRRLRELSWELESTLATVIFVDPSFPRTDSLEREVRVLSLPLPDARELGTMLDTELERLRSREVPTELDDATRERVITAGLGLTATEFANHFYKSVVSRRSACAEIVGDLLAEKKAAVRRLGFELTDPLGTDHIGGYEELLALLGDIAATYTDAAHEYGVIPSKGILLFGYPGTGKDLVMRVASHKLDKPLLKIEMGTIVGAGGGVLGGGMARLRSALAVAEAVGAIIGISEFEKAFGGLASSNQTDGGETARLIAYFLNYMNDSEGTPFIGTANDLSQLQPEQMRSGRFDQVYFMDLPSSDERADIFSVHLRLQHREPTAFDLRALADATKEFTGAEIRTAVNRGLLAGFRQGREVDTRDILAATKHVTPVARMGREQMERMLEYAERELGLKVYRRQAARSTPQGAERAYQI